MRARLINEEQKEGSLFRNTGESWLIEFLSEGEIKLPSDEVHWPPKYISFSRDSNSGSMDTFGYVNIEFNEQMVFDQGAKEIYYEPEFFEQNSGLSLYVTGFSDKWDWYDQEGYFDETEDEDVVDGKHRHEWAGYIETYEHEEEIVIQHLKYVPGLIKHVIFDKRIYDKQKPQKFLLNLLNKNKIPYTL